MEKSAKILKLLVMLIGITAFYGVEAQEGKVSKINYVSNVGAKESKSSKRTAIKLNPLLMARGDVPLYFEMAFSNKISAEIGVGITGFDYLNNRNYNLDDLYTLKYNINLRYSYRLGIRYYAADYSYEPHGFYFGLTYRMQNYTSELKSIDDFDVDKVDISAVNNDVRFEIGYLNTFEEGVFIEPYLGIGFRSRDYDKVSIDLASSSQVFSIDKEKDVVPFLSIGVKIGFSL